MWCGAVRCGVMWCGAVWCDVVWCGVVWCGVMWCGVMWCDVVWCDVVRCGVAWCDDVWCDVVWCDVVWCGVMWCDVVRCGVVWYRTLRHKKGSISYHQHTCLSGVKMLWLHQSLYSWVWGIQEGALTQQVKAVCAGFRVRSPWVHPLYCPRYQLRHAIAAAGRGFVSPCWTAPSPPPPLLPTRRPPRWPSG